MLTIIAALSLLKTDNGYEFINTLINCKVVTVRINSIFTTDGFTEYKLSLSTIHVKDKYDLSAVQLRDSLSSTYYFTSGKLVSFKSHNGVRFFLLNDLSESQNIVLCRGLSTGATISFRGALGLQGDTGIPDGSTMGYVLFYLKRNNAGTGFYYTVLIGVGTAPVTRK